MIVGLNYPYSKDLAGSQIGPNPNVGDWKIFLHDQSLVAKGDVDHTAPRDIFSPNGTAETLTQNLKHLGNMKIGVVRWFLLANGFNYGRAPAPWGPGWDFTPPTNADPRFKVDFARLLSLFSKAHLQIIPSLISFEFAWPRNPNPPVFDYFSASGRSECLTDPTKRQSFLNTMLKDLLDASKGYESSIYCWGVINEPVWETSRYWPGNNPGYIIPHTPPVSTDQMNEFLDIALKQITAAGFRSTVGHRFYDDLADYPTGDMPQFHYYAKSYGPFGDPGFIPHYGLFKRDPKPFLGEFDSDFNAHSNPWPHLSSAEDHTYNRLKILEAEGCDLALIWPDRPLGSDTSDIEVIHSNDYIKLQQRTREQIAQFTGGTVDPGTW